MTFAKKFTELRLEKELTFRQISEACGLSIGYLSDISQGRKSAPNLIITDKMQKVLGVTDNCLIELAQKERVSLAEKIEELEGENARLAKELKESIVYQETASHNAQFYANKACELEAENAQLAYENKQLKIMLELAGKTIPVFKTEASTEVKS
jgi:transcriptional regulator with XRE-family HTH domain